MVTNINTGIGQGQKSYTYCDGWQTYNREQERLKLLATSQTTG